MFLGQPSASWWFKVDAAAEFGSWLAGGKKEEKCRLFNVVHKSAGMDTNVRSLIGGRG